MPPEKRERPPVPPKELLFVYPPDVPGPEPVDAAVICELPPREARWVSKVLRVLHVWALPYPGAGAIDGDELQELGLELMGATYERRHEDLEELLETPLAMILWRLLEYDEVDSEAVAMDCLNVASWAAKHGYVATRLAFGELAAYAVWDHPGWSWVAGRNFRMAGRYREAEQWYRRAARLARWKENWDMMALSLNSLGNVLAERGNYPGARYFLTRAHRVAVRHSLRELEAAVLHDLFVVAFLRGKLREADALARAALEKYPQGHDRLPALAYDIASFWISRGYFARALRVLRPLLSVFNDPDPRLMVLCSTGRAAGACEDGVLFSSCEAEVWKVIPQLRDRSKLATALYDLGLGATSIESWPTAERLLRESLKVAEERGEQDVIFKAEAGIVAARSRHRVDIPHRTARQVPVHPDDTLVMSLLGALESTGVPPVDPT